MSDSLRFQAAVSLAAILLLMFVGCALWDRLPAEMAIHFNFRGQPDQYAPKGFVVLGMPFVFAGFHSICVLTAASCRTLRSAVVSVVLWIVPGISFVVSVLLYTYALDQTTNVVLWAELLVGCILIVVGNILPKDAQKLGIGQWTRRLHPTERSKIARFSGRCLVLCGAAVWICAAAGQTNLAIAVVLIAGVVPRVYAWQRLHRAAHGEAG